MQLCLAALNLVSTLITTTKHELEKLTNTLRRFSHPAILGAIILPNATPYTQNFDTLALSGTSSVIPAGWVISEAGTAADTTYAAGTGSSTTGNTYSFGSTGSTDRALGGLRTGSLIPTIGASFQNGGTSSIQSLAISYWGEQWRLGATGRTDRLDFQYSLNATTLTDGTWTDVDLLDFLSPTTTTTGAKDGNASANRTFLSSAITGLTLGIGELFWIRWTDFDAAGADDGLAIDDFTLTPTFASIPVPAAVPEPSSLLILTLAAVAGIGYQLTLLKKPKASVAPSARNAGNRNLHHGVHEEYGEETQILSSAIPQCSPCTPW